MLINCNATLKVLQKTDPSCEWSGRLDLNQRPSAGGGRSKPSPGRGDGTRTHDLPPEADALVKSWSGRLDLNQRPLRPERSALSQTEPRPDFYLIFPFIYSLPLPVFKNLSCFIASDRVSKVLKNNNSHGPLT